MISRKILAIRIIKKLPQSSFGPDQQDKNLESMLLQNAQVTIVEILVVEAPVEALVEIPIKLKQTKKRYQR